MNMQRLLGSFLISVFTGILTTHTIVVGNLGCYRRSSLWFSVYFGRKPLQKFNDHELSHFNARKDYI